MKKLLSILALLIPMPALAVTLQTITLLPPVNGYNLTTNVGTVQLTPQCSYVGGSPAPDNCAASGITLTWGSTNTTQISVNSSGLVTGAGGVTCATPEAYAYATAGSATITNGSITGGIVTLIATNTLKAGQIVHIAGLSTLTWLNGQSAIVMASGLSGTQFSFLFSHSNVSSTADSGTGTAYVIGHHQVLIDCSTILSVASRPGPVSGTTSTRVVVGSTILLSAVDNNNNGMGDYVAWTTSDATKATVNNIGEVKGIAAGTATITATIAGQSVGRTINVTNPTATNNTYYVRPGGGNRTQSTGLCDVDYPGSGTGTCSAVNEIMYCFTDESSSTIYTGLVQPGDKCSVRPGKVYTVGNKNFSTAWISSNGGLNMPSGTPANPTRLIASCSPNCSTDPDNAGNRVLINTFGSGNANVLFETQNVVMDGFDVTSGEDCNHTVSNGVIPFACPAGHVAFWVLSDSFTSNVTFNNMRIHGMNSNWSGTPGPGVVFNNVSSQFGWLTGINFDNVFGENGNRTDGFTGNGLASSYSGGTESQPKTLTSVSRDGSGNLNIAFAAGQAVNYNVGTNITLTGMTPSDLNGTFPVSAITFNQQSVTITGATCTEIITGTYPDNCVFTTTSTPTFGVGAFVQLVGTFSPSINTGISTYEVFSVGTNQFSITASQRTRPSWPASPTPVTVTCTGTCTAKTANALVATQAGAVGTASVVGTASFVHPVHRMCDQGTSNSCNGDGVGTGNNTISSWFCDRCYFKGNGQDGWDMLHSVMVSSTLTNSFASENEGAPAKLGNADSVTMYNDILLANCSALLAFDATKPPDYNQYLALPCRANGFFGLYSREWSAMNLSGLTWGPGNQNAIWDDNCSDVSPGCNNPLPMATYIAQDSVYIGFKDTNNPGFGGSYPGVYCPDSGTGGCAATNVPAWSWLNNAGYHVGAAPSGGSGNSWALANCPITVCIPDIISSFAGETNALIYNTNISISSALYLAGVTNSFSPTTDFNSTARPSTPSIGALEPAGGPTVVADPTASPVAGTYFTTQIVTLSTTTGGASICYTTNGSTPTAVTAGTCSIGTTYSGAITVASTTTIMALGTLSGATNSNVVTFPYTIAQTVNNFKVGGKAVFGGKSLAR